MYVLAEVWGQDYTSLRMYSACTSKAHRYAVVMLEYQNLIFFAVTWHQMQQVYMSWTIREFWQVKLAMISL